MAKRKVIDPEQGLLLALGHPLRKWLLKLMVEEAEALSPKELADYTKQPLSDVGYHVRRLAEHGAAELERTEPRRGAVMHFYRPTELVRGTLWVLAALGLEDRA
jgi:DNA-binding transcriptional ArsR family regulator